MFDPQNKGKWNYKDNWTLLSPEDSQYHMYDTEACYNNDESIYKGEYNLKFVSKDGKFEAVYNYEGILLDENIDNVNMGTYNYATPKDKYMHGYLDVCPYSDEIIYSIIYWDRGGAQGWFNVKGQYINCAKRSENMDKYNRKDNPKPRERWEHYNKLCK